MLYTKKSNLPGAGLGLFTDTLIKKGEKVIEYLGEIITWAEAEKRDEKGRGGYVYYITKYYCIDAYKYPQHLARFANDARGVKRKKGIRNNSSYDTRGRRGYIIASRNIKPGEEIFVWYGTDYWGPWLETENERKKKERAEKRKQKKNKRQSKRSKKK